MAAVDLSALIQPFLLSVARFSPVLVLPGLTPIGWAPLMVRLALCIAIAAVSANLGAAVPTGTLIAFGGQLVGELTFGLAIAFAVHLPFAALSFTGRLIDVQIGFGAAGIFDPQTRDLEAYTGTILGLAAMATVFALDLHHALLAGLLSTVELTALGTAGLAVDAPTLLAHTATQFTLAFLVMAPVVIGLLLVDVAIAFVARAMPQANVYFLSLPLKAAVGMLLLALTLRHTGPALADLMRRTFLAPFPGAA